jgi:hypothetical protein
MSLLNVYVKMYQYVSLSVSMSWLVYVRKGDEGDGKEEPKTIV